MHMLRKGQGKRLGGGDSREGAATAISEVFGAGHRGRLLRSIRVGHAAKILPEERGVNSRRGSGE